MLQFHEYKSWQLHNYKIIYELLIRDKKQKKQPQKKNTKLLRQLDIKIVLSLRPPLSLYLCQDLKHTHQ